MSWRKIPMKFPGVCIICNEKIAVNEIGLWAQGIGVKHEKCSQTKDLKCIVCDNSAGCQTCEFRDVSTEKIHISGYKTIAIKFNETFKESRNILKA